MTRRHVLIEDQDYPLIWFDEPVRKSRRREFAEFLVIVVIVAAFFIGLTAR